MDDLHPIIRLTSALPMAEKSKKKVTLPQTFSQMVVKHSGIDQPIRYCHSAVFLPL